ncbi:MAG: helix-turn-helix transcriptional regulator [Solirubrobacteraceae bacterium]|nr:helix-turn-helix transcriptional regulator [Solirubrobacteraceae bacterium]
MEEFDHVARTAEVIATKWTPQLLQQLGRAPLGFCDLERAIPGISPRTLTARLRGLEVAGIVQRGLAPRGTSAPYELTAMGVALLPIVAAMQAFGEEWQCAKPVAA